MSTRSVLLAACVVARDPRVDAGGVLDLLARECAVPINVLERTSQYVHAAVLDDIDGQPFMVAVLRGLRAGVAAGCHMATRVNGRGEDDPVEVSARSVDGARKLAEAAGDGQMLVSSDLGAFLTIARARLAPNLEPARVRLGEGAPADAFRLRAAAMPAANLGSRAPTPVTTVDSGGRSQLIERLGMVLTPFLGPIAPVMLRRLPTGRMSAKEFMDAILRDVPEAQYAGVKRVIEEEIRRLR
jgi:hypothetical protein